MKIPKDVSHCLYTGRIRSRLLYSERLRRIWFIDRNRFSYTNYSIEEITDMGFRLVELKPLVLENK